MSYVPVNYWNSRAEKTGLEWTKPEQYGEIDWLIDRMRKQLFPDSIPDVLEIGSGWGRVLLRFRTRGVHVRMQLCDISEEYCKKALEHTGILPDWWDGETLPYADNSFDLVIAQSILLHVEPEMITKVWNELVRVTRKYLYVATMKVRRTKKRLAFESQGNHHCFSHDYTGLMKESGLKILHNHSYTDRGVWIITKK